MPDCDPIEFESYSLPPGYQIRLARRKDFWKINQFILFPTKPNWLFVISLYLLSVTAIVIPVLLDFLHPNAIIFVIVGSIINLIIFLFYVYIFLYILNICRTGKRFRYWIIEYHNKIVGQVIVKIESKGSYLFDLFIMPNHQYDDIDLYFIWNAIQNIPKPIYLPVFTKKNLYKPICLQLGFRPVTKRKSLNWIVKYGLLSETMVLF